MAALSVSIAEPIGLAQIKYRVQDSSGALAPFLVRREGDALFFLDGRALDPAEWDREFGGLASFADLLALVKEAR